MANRTTRRRFLAKTTALGAAAAAAMRPADGRAAGPDAGPMPTIRLGGLEVSRLILGSNPFFGFAHGNPQATDDQMRAFYTEERIMAVMDAAADQGITAVWSPPYDHWIGPWKRYRQGGGRLKIWIGQPDNFDQMAGHITACATHGAKAVCIQGECCGRAIREGRFDLVRGWLKHIKSFNLPAGLASHRPDEILKAEQENLPAEFYHLTIGVPDTFRREDREKAVETIRKMAKPVVAFKVLGAGRLKPAEALPLSRVGRKDGLCVGVLPRQRDELAENAALVRSLTARA